MTFLSDRTLDHLRQVAELSEIPGGRYEILAEVAQGGMGTVYIAGDKELDRRVALKVLSATELGEEGRARMVREARILAKLEHPGIVPVHDVGTLPDGRVFYTMKFVEGERLDDHVEKTPGLRERLRIFERICDAVAFAHDRGFIHRDLKPGNVMVGSFGEVLVMDWGVAKILDEIREDSSPSEVETKVRPANARAPGQTQPGMVLGTPGYMSPEQASGRMDLVDFRTDVYALGVILKELADGSSEAVPRRLKAVVDQALSAERDSRYGSVMGLVSDVSRFLDGERVSAYREGLLEILSRWFHRYRAPILLLLTYLIVRALILIFVGT